MMKMVAAKRAKPQSQIVDPRRVAIKLPTKRIPDADSVVSFMYLWKYSKKYQPDEANSEHVELGSIMKKQFKNGAKGIISTTLTDLPEYKTIHRYQQVFRCTPATYDGKIVDCPSIVVN